MGTFKMPSQNIRIQQNKLIAKNLTTTLCHLDTEIQIYFSNSNYVL